MITVNKFLEIELLRVDNHVIKVYNLALLIVIFLVTWLLLWLIKKAMFRKPMKDEQDIGNTYALFKIVRYAVIVGSITFELDSVGINIPFPQVDVHMKPE